MNLSRRTWLAMAGAMPFAAWARPEVNYPRATSGDVAVEPAWEELVRISVGEREGDIAGNTQKALQAAVDYVAALGGGTVQVLPGTYRLRNSVFLRSGVRLLGSGGDSVLIKEPSVQTTLAEDSDWYDQEITLVNAEGFEVGDGICIRAKNAHHDGMEVLKRTLIARSGPRFKLDKALRENMWMDQTPEVEALFPLLTAEFAQDITVENITVDGNKDNNGALDGNYAGGLWFQDCHSLTFRKVTSRNNNSDGISFQICHDVVVEDCHSHDNAGLGVHPGSGSQRPVMRDNFLERNDIGIFFCWGVKYGLAENNQVTDCKTGISIGHRDHDNVVRNNEVRGSSLVGLVFRPERGEGYTATGNLVEQNRLVDNGPEDGPAVDLQGVTAGNTLARNEIRETRGPGKRIGIRIDAETGDNRVEENLVEGFSQATLDLRSARVN